MKRALAITMAIAGLAAAGDASANFVGFFSPATWTTTVSGNLTGAAGGSAVFTTSTLTLTGGNAASPPPGGDTPACTTGTYAFPGPCQVSATNTHIFTPFVFDWTYTTLDSAGPAGDIFGMLINGVRIQLSDPGGPLSQTGHVVTSAPTTSFGFYVNCTDCIGGAATATISNFSAALVPEPGTIALLGLGAIAVAASTRTRRRKPD